MSIRTCIGDDICEPCSYKLEYVNRYSKWGTLPHEKFAFEDPFENPVDVGQLDLASSSLPTTLHRNLLATRQAF